ncbi:MAG: hypothetical protein Q8942_01210 [Bacillota bacterium]|nr:hypothetical protein [Bacillota bacterium]
MKKLIIAIFSVVFIITGLTILFISGKGNGKQDNSTNKVSLSTTNDNAVKDEEGLKTGGTDTTNDKKQEPSNQDEKVQDTSKIILHTPSASMSANLFTSNVNTNTYDNNVQKGLNLFTNEKTKTSSKDPAQSKNNQSVSLPDTNYISNENEQKNTIEIKPDYTQQNTIEIKSDYTPDNPVKINIEPTPEPVSTQQNTVVARPPTVPETTQHNTSTPSTAPVASPTKSQEPESWIDVKLREYNGQINPADIPDIKRICSRIDPGYIESIFNYGLTDEAQQKFKAYLKQTQGSDYERAKQLIMKYSELFGF